MAKSVKKLGNLRQRAKMDKHLGPKGGLVRKGLANKLRELRAKARKATRGKTNISRGEGSGKLLFPTFNRRKR